jgi:NCS2 family nucleobase:cation symporter-2
METQGGVWGARREVIMRATAALNEFVESAAGLGLVNGKIQAEVSFDEFNLDLDIRYDGQLMEFPSRRPTEEALLADDKAIANLSGFLIRQYADRVRSIVNGRCESASLRSLRDDKVTIDGKIRTFKINSCSWF